MPSDISKPGADQLRKIALHQAAAERAPDIIMARAHRERAEIYRRRYQRITGKLPAAADIAKAAGDDVAAGRGNPTTAVPRPRVQALPTGPDHEESDAAAAAA